MDLELKTRLVKEALEVQMNNALQTLKEPIVTDLPKTILNEEIVNTLKNWIDKGFDDTVPWHVRGMLISCYESCCGN